MSFHYFYCTVRGVKIGAAIGLVLVALSQKAIHICASSTTVVALGVALQIFSVPQSQATSNHDRRPLRATFLGDAEHEYGGRGGVTLQTLPSRFHVDFTSSGSQYFLLLVC